ncbi:MAG: hypothetical protein ABJN95_19300 [Maribacter sp.]|uniref:hypothetical protein n=1 Tax=Maribacter sp. TaxID=1897614 RepID=UPI003296A6CB
MKFKYSIIVVTVFLVFYQSSGQNRITITIPTAESESHYIWRTIQDTDFFEEKKYQVSLPKAPLIAKLKRKSKLGELSGDDYERLEAFIRDSVYRLADYKKGFEKIESELVLINKMINQLNRSSLNWNFKEFETYNVNLTLYGPGGSYDPSEGSILIYTTIDGGFKNYVNPANTIIHEVVHIGIEESIVLANNLPHPTKERIVDTIVMLHFADFLPDYRIQNMGYTGIDEYLKTIDDLNELNTILKRVLSEIEND